MLFKNFIDSVIDRIKGQDKANAEHRLAAGRKVNKAYKEICNNSVVDWRYLVRTGEIRTIANYTTGTVTITKDSRTVTGTNTVWTTAMEGRYFQPQSSSKWYRIRRRVSDTELTLYSAIQEDSAGAQTYIIWNRFYYFPSEVKKVLEFGSWIRDGMVTETSLHRVRDVNIDISANGEPDKFFLIGGNQFESSYSVGTINTTENDTLITGTNTEWLDNVEEGDLINISSIFYSVKRVESDTRIRMLNHSKATLTNSIYEITKGSNLGFQFFLNPNGIYVFPYTYVKRVYDMVNEDNDRPEVPEEFDPAILDLAEADRLSDLDDSKWINKQALAMARINDLRRLQVSVPRYRQFVPKIENSRGRYI